MKISTRQVAMCAMLTALALGLSTLENLFPVTLFIPLPGVKLGLANIVTVFALYQLGAAPALCILVARCLLGSLFAGNASALLFSLLGGVLAMLVMMALTRLRGLSVYGVAPEKQQEVIDRVLKMDLKSVADQLLAQAMAQSQEEFQEAERKGKALEAARRG